MIARIEFAYGGRDKLVEIAATEDGLATLKNIFGSLPSEEHLKFGYMWPEEILIDMDVDGPRLVELGVTFSVKSFKGTLPLTAILPDTRQAVTVYVQVPHIGLLAMNEVQVMENACTDMLQRELDAGWRILCVCPPNAARRPDYILGRARA